MGTVRLDELRAGIEERWDGFLTAEPDIASGFMPWESEVVSRFVQPGDRVLVVGSGTGRDLLAFLELGCRVEGVEPSAAAIVIANRVLAQHRRSAPIVHGFFEDVGVDGAFDVIVFSWLCYSYIPGSGRRVESLRKAAHHLAPGGRILVSCATTREPASSRLVAVQRAVSRLSGSGWQMEDGDDVRLLRAGSDALAFEHTFRPGEFGREAAAAGLSIVHHNRDEWVFVLRARDAEQRSLDTT